MSEYIHVPFAVALLIAVGWTTLFSFANKPGLRGFRNVGILACYVVAPVFLFVAGWRSALLTWAAFGVAGGVLYICWEMLQRLRTPAGEPKPEVSLAPLAYSLVAWPVLVPEAVEYALAELGALRAPSLTRANGSGEPCGPPKTDPAPAGGDSNLREMSERRDASHTPVRRQDIAAGWRLVCYSLFTVLVVGLLMPNFVRAGGEVSMLGVVLGAAGSFVCSVAFIRCPRRCVVPKLLIFVLLWPALYLGVLSVVGAFGAQLGLLP
jgi:hypothetical protein